MLVVFVTLPAVHSMNVFIVYIACGCYCCDCLFGVKLNQKKFKV